MSFSKSRRPKPAGPLTLDSTVKPIAPVLILYGNKDTALPPWMGEFYRNKVCAIGGNVARIQLLTGQNHFTTPPMSPPYCLPWVRDHLACVPAPDGCTAKWANYSPPVHIWPAPEMGWPLFAHPPLPPRLPAICFAARNLAGTYQLPLAWLGGSPSQLSSKVTRTNCQAAVRCD